MATPQPSEAPKTPTHRPSTSPRLEGKTDSSKEPQSPIRNNKKKTNKKIDKKHPEFELTYDMMLGIRTTVSQIESKSHRLKDSDMSSVTKLRFPADGSSTTPAHSMRDFKFKDYAPEVFRKIRHMFGINPADYLLCVCGDFQYLEFISNSKSGQFFFYTHDRKYMIKTVSDEECVFLRKILPDYYRHLSKNPDTLLTRFYGMHRVKPHKKKEFHFLVMQSVFYTDKFIHTTFDLKGSTQGREVKKKDIKPGCVYKDVDFLNQKITLNLGAVKGQLFEKQIAADSEFLRRLKIMDYSLLLGIHYKNRDIPRQLSFSVSMSTAPGMSIFDVTKEKENKDKERMLLKREDSKTKVDDIKKNDIPTATTTTTTNSTTTITTTTTTTTTINETPSLVPSNSNNTNTTTKIEESKQQEENKEKEESQVLSFRKDESSPTNSNSDNIQSTTPHHSPISSPVPQTQQLSPSLSPLILHLPQQPNNVIITTTTTTTTETVPVSPKGPSSPDKKLRELEVKNDNNNNNNNNNNGDRKDLKEVNPSSDTVSVQEIDQIINSMPPMSRRQSHYGVPKNYNQIISPSIINFVAPEFNKVALPDAKKNKEDEDGPRPPSVFTNDDGGVSSVMSDGRPGNEIYFCGIIDILTEYGVKKKVESFGKSFKYAKKEISAVDPTFYATRFKDFIYASIRK